MANDSRRYLVYVPCKDGHVKAELFGDGRRFAVAMNEYSGHPITEPRAEWLFSRPGHKWQCIAANILPLIDKYDAFCFLDDDIEITTDELNRLFDAGMAHNADLWQASLSLDSFDWWPELIHRDDSAGARKVSLVEVMMPCFSRASLVKLFSTFTENYCGWGLDLVWAKLLDGKGMFIVDDVVAKHLRPLQSGHWILPNGMTSFQDRDRVLKKYGITLTE